MNQEQHSFSQTPISLSFDDFEISAESFKPVTKGLGFHQETKKSTFTQAPQQKIEKQRSMGPLNNISTDIELKIKNHIPSGLEAFYGAAAVPQENMSEVQINITTPEEILREASPVSQLSAWIIDLTVILSLVAITAVCLVLVSGIDYKLILKLVSRPELAIFSSSIFAIYYILYFTILDLSASPGKMILGIHLTGTDNNNFSVKNTFIRTMVSLLSILAFCLPMLLDFQGRLSDTKLVK